MLDLITLYTTQRKHSKHSWCFGVLGLQLFLLYTAEFLSIVENKLYGYADDSTLVAVVPSPGESIAISESMNRDLNRVSVWCYL